MGKGAGKGVVEKNNHYHEHLAVCGIIAVVLAGVKM
jgi:hypothetical protein